MQSRRRIYERRVWKVLFKCVVVVIFSIAVYKAVGLALNRLGLFRKSNFDGTAFMLEAPVSEENHSLEGSNDRYNKELHQLLVTSHNEFDISEQTHLSSTQLQCRFDTCFDFSSSCKTGFRIFSSPPRASDIKDRIRSPVYLKILNSIRQSVYHTTDPSNACVFVLTTDTIDRDKLSADFIQKIEQKINHGDLWRSGKNFIVFNLFSGTWPDYAENLGFDFGYAMVAKASFSEEKLRRRFDVSFPLFQKDHPQISRADSYENQLFPLERKYRVAFKGKRYLFGIGSEVRDAIHLLHNDKDVIMLTSCKHGKNWQKFQDSKCHNDTLNFERYDYQELLYNSTFCLVPRGRRLGSFRFFESLKAGCIPVVLSDGWELPFSEVIDWSRAAIQISEKALLQVPSMLRSITKEKILSLRQQGFFLHATYFSSIQQIVSTTLKILHDRVEAHKADYHMWNYPPGALSVHSSFSTQLVEFPFYHELLGSKTHEKFTAVILAVSPVRFKSGKLFKLIEAINLSEYVAQILVVWLAPTRIPDKTSWPSTKTSLRVVYPKLKVLGSRFLESNLIWTDAVFSFNEDVVITKSEVDFAFRQWRSFPERLVGFTTRDHVWDQASNSWMFTSRISSTYSMIMLNAAVYHRYYNHLYMNHLPKEASSLISNTNNCEDMAFNFMISHVTNKSPIKVAHSHHFDPGDPNKEVSIDGRKKADDIKSVGRRFKQKQRCFRELTRIFGRVTLKKSIHKLDPLLYKDPISNYRKRYRNLES